MLLWLQKKNLEKLLLSFVLYFDLYYALPMLSYIHQNSIVVCFFFWFLVHIRELAKESVRLICSISLPF